MNYLAPGLISPTVTHRTTSCFKQSVDKVGFTIFNWNFYSMFATGGTIAMADIPENFTIFHCRMNTIQPTWPCCTTSVCWHTRCWHFCSSTSHKTIPSLNEIDVTKIIIKGCFVVIFSLRLCQACVVVTTIG